MVDVEKASRKMIRAVRGEGPPERPLQIRLGLA
ncbi:MAG: hypothetical protein QOJ51_2494 [Acidobacteriaceae bacterium]|jgi:hypothetical protein|nr:hypothetical protein [Acidobacteriaceae bacterium]